jgi:hypothetical protein
MDAATAETIDQSGDTAGGCHFHSLCLRFISVARVRSGFVLIALASGYGIGVGRFSRPQGAVGVLAMLGAGLDTMRRIKSVWKDPLGVSVLWLIVSGMAVGLFIDRQSVVHGFEVMGWVISAMWELFSEDEGVEFWPWIAEGTKLPSWADSLSLASTETRLLAGGSCEFPDGKHFVWFCPLPRVHIFCMTGVVSGWGLWEGIVQYRWFK